MLDVVWLEFRPCIVPRGVAVCNIMGRISSVVLRDVAGLDIIDGAFRCATGGQRARRHMRTLLSCRGTLPGSMALTESFAVLDVVWLEFRPFIVLRGVAVCNIIGRISSVVLRDVAGLDIIDRALRCATGRRRARRRQWSLSWDGKLLRSLSGVAGLDVIGGVFRRAGRCSSCVIDLSSCRGTSPCATSSPESLTSCRGTSQCVPSSTECLSYCR